MLVEIGNQMPLRRPEDLAVVSRGPAVTYVNIPNGTTTIVPDPSTGAEVDVPLYGMTPGADLQAIVQHIMQRPNGVTNLPGHEALLALIHPGGLWPQHGAVPPSWIWAENSEFANQVGQFYGCAVGRPGNVEETHWTHAGPPGVIPLARGPEATTTNHTHDQIWASLVGNANSISGTATSTDATHLNNTGATWTTNQFTGQWVVAGTAYAAILSNTGTSLVLDRWYTPGSEGGAAASTPSGTSTYIILGTSPPALFMGISANTSAVGSGDTTLTGEITTVGGGLIRKIATLAHTAGTSSGTVTVVFTANGTDSLPVTIGKAGISSSILSTLANLYLTLLPTTATLSASGDQLTLTDTVSTLG